MAPSLTPTSAAPTPHSNQPPHTIPLPGDNTQTNEPALKDIFGYAIKNYFAKAFTFTGHASRGEFWWMWGAGLALTLCYIIATNIMDLPAPSTITVAASALSFVLFFPMISLSVRRARDSIAETWLVIAPFVIGITAIAFTSIFTVKDLPDLKTEYFGGYVNYYCEYSGQYRCCDITVPDLDMSDGYDECYYDKDGNGTYDHYRDWTMTDNDYYAAHPDKYYYDGKNYYRNWYKEEWDADKYFYDINGDNNDPNHYYWDRNGDGKYDHYYSRDIPPIFSFYWKSSTLLDAPFSLFYGGNRIVQKFTLPHASYSFFWNTTAISFATLFMLILMALPSKEHQKNSYIPITPSAYPYLDPTTATYAQTQVSASEQTNDPILTELTNPTTSAIRLHEIANLSVNTPKYRELLLAHPNLYPELDQWLRQLP